MQVSSRQTTKENKIKMFDWFFYLGTVGLEYFTVQAPTLIRRFMQKFCVCVFLIEYFSSGVSFCNSDL